MRLLMVWPYPVVQELWLPFGVKSDLEVAVEGRVFSDHAKVWIRTRAQVLLRVGLN